MSANSEQSAILVSGDVVVDHHIYEGRRKDYGDGRSPGVQIVKELGGAALIDDLLQSLLERAASDGDQQWTSRMAMEVPELHTDASLVDTSKDAYAFWRPFPHDAARNKQYWRVSEAMGFGAVQSDPPCQSWEASSDLPSAPRIIVLSDGGMGFRQSPDCWQNLNFKDTQWIVLKTAAPLCRGALWESLTREHSEKLVVVLSARELRKSTARLSSGLSWDETLETFVRELDGKLAGLCRCRHLLVAFESDGGVWVDLQRGTERKVQLVYSASSIEGDQARETSGSAFGLLSCVTAAAAWQLTMAEENTTPDLSAALEGGLSAMSDLLARGHGPVSDTPHGFPAQRLANVIKHPTRRYSRATLHNPIMPGWSLLRESQRRNSPAYDLGRLVVKYGPIALASLPHLTIGNLITVGRREIESLRTLSQVISRYKDHDSGKKPLSLGVFGPPGSGKSFAVKQLAKNLVGSDGWLEFNLSQFDTPSDLIGAFHQIRDRVLQGLLPVAFFDEFDSQNFRWLQYLLAPMQDGRFQEGQITHPVGKCILAFAGGTSWTFGTFGPKKSDAKLFRDFRLKKGPDFQSRLDGYLDVIGPNQRLVPKEPEDDPPPTVATSAGRAFAADQEDLYFPIRRALMIRGAFRCAPNAELDIDEGLLRALLQVKSYRHGSRSLNKILQPLQMAAADVVHASLLAPRDELGMHTDPDAFLQLVDNTDEAERVGELSESLMQVMGPAIHGVYNELGRKEGWLTQETPFDQLDPTKKQSNFEAAKEMPRILALVGLKLEDGLNGNDEQQAAVRQHTEYHLELLAEAEHDRWMKWLLSQGWQYADKRDDDARKHDCLVPYQQLHDKDKNKDRTQIRNYPAFARKAGMTIVFAT